MLGCRSGLLRMVGLHLLDSCIDVFLYLGAQAGSVFALGIEVVQTDLETHHVGRIELIRQFGLVEPLDESGVDIHDERGGIALVHHGHALIEVASKQGSLQRQGVLGIANDDRRVVHSAADGQIHQVAHLRLGGIFVLVEELVIQTRGRLLIARIR